MVVVSVVVVVSVAGGVLVSVVGHGAPELSCEPGAALPDPSFEPGAEALEHSITGAHVEPFEGAPLESELDELPLEPDPEAPDEPDDESDDPPLPFDGAHATGGGNGSLLSPE